MVQKCQNRGVASRPRPSQAVRFCPEACERLAAALRTHNLTFGYFGHSAHPLKPMYDFGTVASTKKLKFLVSLTTNDNDYQIEQAADAEEAAKRLGVQIQIVYADNDSITQSQQILNVIQSRSESLPDGIVFEPVGGTALPQVARAA